jgi:ribonuclease BN (tRNA processing enzyme)
MLFTKSRRAQSVDDYETWVESEFTNTLKTFDLGDIRTTTLIIFYGNRVADIRIQGDVINTLQARMGTGGNNMPILAYAFQLNGDRDNPGVSVSEDQAFTIPANPMSDRGQSVAYSIREDAKANNFSATEIEQARALQSLQPSVQSHHAQTFIAEPMRVRRLTPTECERLQGFPDGWTDEQSDTQRYKQMGNAVTVNVIEWIGSRL